MKCFTLIVLCIILLSCNKVKRASAKLMKGEIWYVSDITVAGTSQKLYGTWNITNDVNIYDSVPTALWKIENEEALFKWQFQDRAKHFIINYKCQCDGNTSSLLDTLDYRLYSLSGTYDVNKHATKQMIFKSNSTIGYSGQEVKITINRKSY